MRDTPQDEEAGKYVERPHEVVPHGFTIPTSITCFHTPACRKASPLLRTSVSPRTVMNNLAETARNSGPSAVPVARWPDHL